MPIYEFVCRKCGHKFELLRRLSQAGEDAACPKCQQAAGQIMSTFASFSNNGGIPTPVGGGSSCASCGASSCASCAG